MTVSINGEARECEDEVLDKEAQADIIWVDDESYTMNNNRQQIANNATVFFDRVTQAGVRRGQWVCRGGSKPGGKP